MVVKNISFTNSNLLREKARSIIPLGAQTFTRSYTQFPYNFSPLFLKRADKAHIWDVDDNEYVDLLSGLLSVILGYQDDDVNQAIIKQMQNGITFSLSSELEIELAELLIDIIPSAEMVRYGKNGSDCTSAAIRLARHCTKKDYVAVCGYHGWQDWYVGTTSLNNGVPKAVQDLTHTFEYNNIGSLEDLFKKFPNKFAAVIMEPMNLDLPQNNFLQQVQEITHKNNALLIFDEVITGFRFALGGAQELFSVTPDLSIFGKAMANGMPLSVLVGKAIYMRHLEQVFYSSTFAAETLSLAASIATIKKIKKENVLSKIWKYGADLKQQVQALIDQYSLNDVVKLKGLEPWIIVTFQDHDKASRAVLRTFFQKEMISQGVFILTSHNINYSHTEKDKETILAAYVNTFSKMSQLLENGDIQVDLGTKIIEPVFSVRKY